MKLLVNPEFKIITANRERDIPKTSKLFDAFTKYFNPIDENKANRL